MTETVIALAILGGSAAMTIFFVHQVLEPRRERARHNENDFVCVYWRGYYGPEVDPIRERCPVCNPANLRKLPPVQSDHGSSRITYGQYHARLSNRNPDQHRWSRVTRIRERCTCGALREKDEVGSWVFVPPHLSQDWLER